MSSAIPVTMGFTWGSALLVVLNVLVGGVIVQMIRARPALKKIAADREENLLKARGEDMDALRERVDKLEGIIERERARHEAERAVDRHRINNLQQCFDAIVLLIETDPTKAAETVRRIKDMRARQLETEALEKAAIHAGNISAVAT